MLDDPRNDLYIHVDLKSTDFPYDFICGLIRHSRITFVKRHNVTWGGYSLIKAEIELLREATKDKHAYYHLLSGNSLPLATPDEIFSFFDGCDRNYVHISETMMAEDTFLDRIKYYHLLSDITGRKTGFLYRLLRLISKFAIIVQKALKSNRVKNSSFRFMGGINWFHITHELATYIVANESIVKKIFSRGFCVDELFVQTLAYNSPFCSTLVNESLFFMDWNRGRPYTFTLEDFDDIKASGKLFARKFSDQHIDVVERVFCLVKSRKSSVTLSSNQGVFP